MFLAELHAFLLKKQDIGYFLALIATILFGHVTRKIGNATASKWCSSLFGLGLVVLLSGTHALVPAVAVIIHTVLIKVLPKKNVHWISFVVGFIYLFLYRSCGTLLESICSPSRGYTNAIQMIMTLKLIGLAFEVHDSENTESQMMRYTAVNPSALDIFHYSFTHLNDATEMPDLFTNFLFDFVGPYFKYRVFEDMHHAGYSDQADCLKSVLQRIKPVPAYILLFFLSDYLWPLDIVLNESFYQESSFWGRVVFMTPVFFNFRMRLYTGFVLSECTCIMAGLGAYPTRSQPRPGEGPSNFDVLDEIHKNKAIAKEEMNFETIHNMDEYGAESVSTMREALKTWNKTVQFWLASNVYRRLSGVASRNARTLAVMAISSAWHGVYAGYYLSLGSVVFVLPVEDLYEKILRRRLVENDLHGWVKAYDWTGWFFRFQWFSYLGMAFRLLAVDPTIRFWQSVYFIGHLSLVVFYIIGIIFVKPIVNQWLPKKAREEESKKNS